MTEVFFGSMAFSLGLMAFTGAAWMTLSNSSGANKLVGSIIAILAIFCLVFTSYNLARVVFLQRAMQNAMMMSMKSNPAMMGHHNPADKKTMSHGKTQKSTTNKKTQ